MERLLTVILFFFLFSCSTPLIKFPETKNITKIDNPQLLEKAEKLNEKLLKQNQHLTLVANCRYIDPAGGNSFGFILFTEYPDKFNMEIIYLAKMVMRLITDGKKGTLLVPSEKRLYVSYREESIRPDYPLFKLGFETLLSIISYIPIEGKKPSNTLTIDDAKNYCLQTVSKTGSNKIICYNKDFSNISEIVLFDEDGKKYHINYSFNGADYSYPEKIQIFDFAEQSEILIEFAEKNFSLPSAPDLFKENPDPGISVLELQ